MHSRAIVYPQGLPLAGRARNRCDELVLLCGGDPQRQFERETGTLADFSRYLSRLPAFRLRQVEALVVFTLPDPLDLLVVARYGLERQLPVLERASWLIYWDEVSVPRFPEHLQREGSLDAPLNGAPIWCSNAGPLFLVLTATTSEQALVPRLRELRHESLRPAGRGSADSARAG